MMCTVICLSLLSSHACVKYKFFEDLRCEELVNFCYYSVMHTFFI